MQNIVATFDDPNSARLAISRLKEAGIPDERIRYDPSLDTEFRHHAGSSQSRPGHAGYKRQGLLESFGSFWANLLESHTDEAGIYSEALRRGTSVVMVRSEHDEVSKVCRILQYCGSKSLEERVGQWRAEGWAPEAAKDASPSTVQGTQSPAPPRGGPVGTHSFTGAGAAVGMPSTGPANEQSEHARERAVAAAKPQEADPGR
jgi:hypothetical protein